MIHFVLRLFVRFVLAIFYREISIAGAADPGGPIVFVANHPNTLMDALIIASRFQRKAYIIARGSLFTGPLRSFLLRAVGVLPVMRRQELGGDPGKSNEDTFSACYDALAAGSPILIFGEGTSHLEPQLKPLKTGAARIAIGAEERRGPLGVRLVPVGLTYQDPELFGSRVRIRFSDPLPVLPFLERAGDSFEAARQLTALVERCLAEEIVHLDDPDQQDMLVTIDRWIGQRLVNEERHRLDASRVIGRVINHFNLKEPERVAEFQATLAEYHAMLKEAGLDDAALEPPRPRKIPRMLGLFLGYPIWAWGAVNHLIPYNIPRLLLSFIKLHPVYTSTIKLLAGILAFAICYGLQGFLVFSWIGSPWGWIYIASLPLFGVATLQLQYHFEELSDEAELLMRLEEADHGTVTRAQEVRSRLMEALEQGEKEYLKGLDTEDQPAPETPIEDAEDPGRARPEPGARVGED